MDAKDVQKSKPKNPKALSMGKSRKGSGILFPVATLLLFALSLALFALPRVSKGFANRYSGNIYPLWQGSLGRFSGLFPFALSELILYSLPILLIIDIAINRKRLLQVLKHIVFALALILFLYEANCGVNYYRDTFAKTEGIEVRSQFTKEELYDFCLFAVNGIIENPGEYPRGKALALEAKSAMEGLAEKYPSLKGYYPNPKALVVSRPFTKMEVTGIYSPFTIEANYNRELPGYDLPYTACHELSHLRGFMDEGEANFIGWLACLNSDNQSFRRSAYMLAWIYGGNALNKEDPKLRESLRNMFPEEAKAEFKAANEFWAAYESPASQVQNKINDAYLKSNGLKEGIKSYDGVLALMLSWYQDNH